MRALSTGKGGTGRGGARGQPPATPAQPNVQTYTPVCTIRMEHCVGMCGAGGGMHPVRLVYGAASRERWSRASSTCAASHVATMASVMPWASASSCQRAWYATSVLATVITFVARLRHKPTCAATAVVGLCMRAALWYSTCSVRLYVATIASRCACKLAGWRSAMMREYLQTQEDRCMPCVTMPSRASTPVEGVHGLLACAAVGVATSLTSQLAI